VLVLASCVEGVGEPPFASNDTRIRLKDAVALKALPELMDPL